ncbi:MAG: hypothetical protein QGG36_25205 [Pirellulaceae bacterium]|nr:hypothetical protein [Pirellulaceae bacterium]
MSRRQISLALLLAVSALASTGCVGISSGLNAGIFGIPIPVSPYFQKLEEDQHHVHDRYARVPILGPVTAGGAPVALDPPSDDEVMRAFEKANPIQGGLPFFHEVQINNVRIVKDKIADYMDPPRFYPLVGPAQLHHAHYKCTIYYSKITHVGWPLPHTLSDEAEMEVIYIDHNHLHIVGNVDTGPGAPF